MTIDNQKYEVYILNYAINKHIDNLLPSNSQSALNIIMYQSDALVWKVATEIYTKSGHKISFSSIKNILNLRIKPLKAKIVEEEAIKKQEAIKQARIKAELKAQKEAKEAEEARQLRIRKKAEFAKWEKIAEFKKAYPDINMGELEIIIFIKIRNIVVKVLQVDKEQVNLDTYIINNLGEEALQIKEIVAALEETFNIEIPDEVCEQLFTIRDFVNFVCQKTQMDDHSVSLINEINLD